MIAVGTMKLICQSVQSQCNTFLGSGEVIVHRLNLQKIWTHAPPSEQIRVRALDWCPHEKIVAVGYCSGVVMLLDIEQQLVVHQCQLDAAIRCLGWTQNSREIIDDSATDNPLDAHDVYLPPLPSFSSLTSNAPKTDYNATELYAKRVLNILIVGLANGVVHMSVFGVLPCGRINVAELMKRHSSATSVDLIDVKMSADFRQLQVFAMTDDDGATTTRSLQLVTLDNEMLPTYLWPLLQLATKHGHILNTLGYIDDIIQCITEAWETALLEMDNKLTKYANAHPDGSVSADFLDLLMFGVPSESLEEFLTRCFYDVFCRNAKSDCLVCRFAQRSHRKGTEEAGQFHRNQLLDDPEVGHQTVAQRHPERVLSPQPD